MINRCKRFIGMGVTIALLSSCAATRQAQTPEKLQPPTAPQTFKQPVVPPQPVTKTVPLLPPTTAENRLSQIPATGRSDPFSNLLPDRITLTSLARPGTAKPAAVAKPTQPAATQPAPPKATTPNSIAVKPLPQPNQVPVAAAPIPQRPVSPTRLAEGVEIRGILQLGDRPVAIVKAPEEGTVRYVSVGDSMSNGQVLVKQILVSKGAEPRVILQQNGVDVVRRVSGSTSPIASR